MIVMLNTYISRMKNRKYVMLCLRG